MRDRAAGVTARVSVSSSGVQANNESFVPAISADGRFVAFESFATNLVEADTNGHWDVFVHDRHTGQTQRVSESNDRQANGGSFSADLSADGRFVAFESFATNLASGDTNDQSDVFVHDGQTGITERVSVSIGGGEADHASFDPSLSADGRVVSFYSFATNLVPRDTNNQPDVFVYDRAIGTTERVSVARSGRQGRFESFSGRISADGNVVSFCSLSRLVPHDRNDTYDVFVHDRKTDSTELTSVSSEGGGGNSGSFSPDVSADGRFVAFDSQASNLVPNDTNFGTDVFVRDRGARL